MKLRKSALSPAKERVKKPNGVTNTRHSRESGNPLRRFRKKNRADTADGRLRIPAFERAKKSNGHTNTRHSRESGNLLRRFRKKNRADTADGRLRIPAFERAKKSNGHTNTRHSRESGNLLRRFRKKNRADTADGRLRIPAFAGMTKHYSMVIVFTMPILRRSVRHDERRAISSHARRRESGSGSPQYRPGSLCGTAATDSRFRGNDEE